jgi:protein TonB
VIAWLNRHRDPAAAATTVVLFALSWSVYRLTPVVAAAVPTMVETVMRFEELPLPEPALPAPPMPAVRPQPAPTTPPPAVVPASPTPVTPAPVQTVAAVPVAAPAPPAVATPAATTPVLPHVPPPVPAPVLPPAPVAPARNLEDAYRGELRGYLSGIKRYPNSREARQLRPTGTVKVWIELDRAGQLIGSGIDSSSGSSLLDSEALRTVRNGRYPTFPAEGFPGQSFHRFIVPIEYLVDGA